MSAALAEGAIRPLAHRIFAFGELDNAIRLKKSSGHIGKLVLEPLANAGVRLREPPAITLRRDGTYLVAGGVEGFGFEAARWLVARGAGSIALIGRRGSATPDCDARIGELEAAGAEVRVYRGDVADRASLAGVLEAIRAVSRRSAASCTPRRLSTTVSPRRSRSCGSAGLRPKLGGALALDALTRDDPIELFLLFSSATTLIGAPASRRLCGSEYDTRGLGAAAQGRGSVRTRRRLGSDRRCRLSGREAGETRCARAAPRRETKLSGRSAGGTARDDLERSARCRLRRNQLERSPPFSADPRQTDVLEARAGGLTSTSDEPFSERLAGLEPDAALALLKSVIAEEAATILRLPASGIDPLRPLSEMGMDSLMAVELRLALETRLRVDLPLVSLVEGTSVASIAGRLATAISTEPKDGDLIALVARHEGMYQQTFSADDAQTTAAVVEPKSVAAE